MGKRWEEDLTAILRELGQKLGQGGPGQLGSAAGGCESGVLEDIRACSRTDSDWLLWNKVSKSGLPAI